ncbi:hypothetical protein GGI23_001255 [Coemansia sp. RSA 2559]|nr:hypothetical protein GGI23_001255 [Coemansia sp. RSA 2559]
MAETKVESERPDSAKAAEEPCEQQPMHKDRVEAQATGTKAAVGLSTSAAKSKLLEILDADHTRVLVPPHFDRRSRSLWAILGGTIAIIGLLLVNGGYLLGKGEPRQTRGIGSVVEAALLVVSIVVSYWVVERESRLETCELDMRLQAISKEIGGWTGIYADLRTPQLPTVTTYTVLRDGVWRDVPTLLVVEGDTVALAYGEAAPCLLSLRGVGTADAQLRLDRSQRFTADTMRAWRLPEEDAWNPLAAGHPALAGRVLFHVRATPLGSHLEQIARHHQRTGRSVLQNQMRVVIRLCALRIMPVVCAAAVVANAVIYGVVSARQEAHFGMGVEAVVGKSVYVVFPFACTVLWPVLWIGARIFANACGVVLFDTLQRSKTEYEDTDNIDEFDIEALPPTKDVTVGLGAIVDRMRWMWWNCDFRTLSRSSNLAETLGNITVICSIDKEGTIAEPFCTPEQIVVPDGTDYAILDVGEQQVGAERRTFIIDAGWERFLPSLRPLGLDCSLSTAAHSQGIGGATHRRHNRMHRHGKILPSQDTCLCKIGRAIGFADADLRRYTKLNEIDVFAPFHTATDALAAKDVFCAASFTSTVVQPRGEGAVPGMLHMLTDGNVDLVLGMCLDYFDGSAIRPLDDHTVAMYYSLYLNALQQDLQCLAFSYRPLSVDVEAIGWPGWREPSSTERALNTQSKFIDLRLSRADLQAALDKHSAERRPVSLAEGTIDSVGDDARASALSATVPVEAAADKKAGVLVTEQHSSSRSQTAATSTSGENSNAKADGTQNSSPMPDVAQNSSEMTDVAQNNSTAPGQERFGLSDDDSDEIATHSSSLDDLPDHLTEEARKALLCAKAKFDTQEGMQADEPTLAQTDYPKAALAQLACEEDMLRDAVTEQIFVGLATFVYEPKTDVCDFIEDLDVAGIRFVYFSRAGGRQSKAFAERLGLETDWNTCILLSSAGADGVQGDGYIEDHDIKARLPRGIENIRQHLKDVDDIPLQISLFAECTADATREMIKISQEYGDVVCCIGSALQDSNTLTFAAADLAVGVEPIPHFNRVLHSGSSQRAAADDAEAAAALRPGHDMANDGSISTSGALVTQYALGAALTCIPCPLFLQHDTSLYMLMQVVSEARRLVACVQQAAVFLAGTCLALAAANLVAALCLLPPALPGYMALWVLWVVAPLLAAALLFAPHDENVMSTMPLRNHAHVSDLRRFSAYAAIRMAPPVAITVVVYATALAALLEARPGVRQLSRALGHADWLRLSAADQRALAAAQAYATVAFAFHCTCISATLMFRTRTCVEFVPLRSLAWAAAAAAALALTFALAALLVALGGAPVARVPWYTYVVAFAGPLALLPLQDLCKLHDKKRWTRLQKLAKLEFKTKLGLHSPL